MSPRPFNLDGSPRKPYKLNDPHWTKRVADAKVIPPKKLAQAKGGIRCYDCEEFLTPASFRTKKGACVGRGGICNYCRLCEKKRREGNKGAEKLRESAFYKANRQEKLAAALAYNIAHPEKLLVRWAGQRSAKLGVPFSITEADVVVPEVCPALGIRLERNVGVKGKGLPNSPSIDRIIPELGYVPGNIAVISRKANTLKWKHPLAELQKMARWILTLKDPREVAP